MFEPNSTSGGLKVWHVLLGIVVIAIVIAILI